MIVHILCMMRNRTCSDSGVALNEINEETGELYLPNNFGRVYVVSCNAMKELQ